MFGLFEIPTTVFRFSKDGVHLKQKWCCLHICMYVNTWHDTTLSHIIITPSQPLVEPSLYLFQHKQWRLPFSDVHMLRPGYETYQDPTLNNLSFQLRYTLKRQQMTILLTSSCFSPWFMKTLLTELYTGLPQIHYFP